MNRFGLIYLRKEDNQKNKKQSYIYERKIIIKKKIKFFYFLLHRSRERKSTARSWTKKKKREIIFLDSYSPTAIFGFISATSKVGKWELRTCRPKPTEQLELPTASSSQTLLFAPPPPANSLFFFSIHWIDLRTSNFSFLSFCFANFSFYLRVWFVHFGDAYVGFFFFFFLCGLLCLCYAWENFYQLAKGSSLYMARWD